MCGAVKYYAESGKDMCILLTLVMTYGKHNNIQHYNNAHLEAVIPRSTAMVIRSCLP